LKWGFDNKISYVKMGQANTFVTCDYCFGKFRLRMDLVEHISKMHGKNVEVSNEQHKDKRFKPDQIEILDVENDTISRQFQCQKCNETFSKQKDLINHRYKSHTIQCNECEYNTPYEHDITRHYSYVHNNEMSGKYGCSRCDYRTQDVEKLKRHQTNHQMVIRSYSTKVRLYLEKHRLPFTMQTETPSDGDCFYHALLDQLRLKPSLWEIASQKPNIQGHFTGNQVPGLDKMTQSGLKSLIMSHIRIGGTDNVVCDECPNRCTNGSDHVDYLSTPRIWADEFVIQGATSLLDINLCLILPNCKTENYSWSSDPITNLYMFYFPKLHFQSLAPIVSEEKCLARLKSIEKEIKEAEKKNPVEIIQKSDEIEIVDDTTPNVKSTDEVEELSVCLLKCSKCKLSFSNAELMQNHHQTSHKSSQSLAIPSFEQQMKMIQEANAKRLKMFQDSGNQESTSLKNLMTLSTLLQKRMGDTSKNTVDLDNDNLKPKEATLSKSPLRNVRMNRRNSSTGTKESKDINDNEISEIHPLLIDNNDVNNNDIDLIEVESSQNQKFRSTNKDDIKQIYVDGKLKYSCSFCDEIFSSENLVKYHIPSCDKSIQRKKAPKINSSKVRPMPNVGIKTAKSEDTEIAIDQAEKLESYNLSFESDKDLASLKDNEMYEEKRMAELVEFSTHSSSLNSELKALLV